jgi:hypothetical protein
VPDSKSSGDNHKASATSQPPDSQRSSNNTLPTNTTTLSTTQPSTDEVPAIDVQTPSTGLSRQNTGSSLAFEDAMEHPAGTPASAPAPKQKTVAEGKNTEPLPPPTPPAAGKGPGNASKLPQSTEAVAGGAQTASDKNEDKAAGKSEDEGWDYGEDVGDAGDAGETTDFMHDAVIVKAEDAQAPSESQPKGVAGTVTDVKEGRSIAGKHQVAGADPAKLAAAAGSETTQSSMAASTIKDDKKAKPTTGANGAQQDIKSKVEQTKPPQGAKPPSTASDNKNKTATTGADRTKQDPKAVSIVKDEKKESAVAGVDSASQDVKPKVDDASTKASGNAAATPVTTIAGPSPTPSARIGQNNVPKVEVARSEGQLPITKQEAPTSTAADVSRSQDPEKAAVPPTPANDAASESASKPTTTEQTQLPKTGATDTKGSAPKGTTTVAPTPPEATVPATPVEDTANKSASKAKAAEQGQPSETSNTDGKNPASKGVAAAGVVAPETVVPPPPAKDVTEKPASQAKTAEQSQPSKTGNTNAHGFNPKGDAATAPTASGATLPPAPAKGTTDQSASKEKVPEQGQSSKTSYADPKGSAAKSTTAATPASPEAIVPPPPAKDVAEKPAWQAKTAEQSQTSKTSDTDPQDSTLKATTDAPPAVIPKATAPETPAVSKPKDDTRAKQGSVPPTPSSMQPAATAQNTSKSPPIQSKPPSPAPSITESRSPVAGIGSKMSNILSKFKPNSKPPSDIDAPAHQPEKPKQEATSKPALRVETGNGASEGATGDKPEKQGAGVGAEGETVVPASSIPKHIVGDDGETSTETEGASDTASSPAGATVSKNQKKKLAKKARDAAAAAAALKK